MDDSSYATDKRAILKLYKCMLKGMQIQDISKKNFRKYGCAIEYPNIDKKGDKRNLWRIVHRSLDKTGWRVAYLVLRDKSVGRLECHPDSDETLEPVSGKAILLISNKKDISSMEVFHLNKPVVIYKGIWHGLISLDKEAHIKIVENEKVASSYFYFKTRLDSNNIIKIKKGL